MTDHSEIGAQFGPRGLSAEVTPPAARRTKLRFVPLKQFHVKRVVAHQKALHIKSDMSDASIDAMCAGRHAMAAVLDGTAAACGGLLDEGNGRARAWSIIADDMPLAGWKDVIAHMRAAIDAALAPGGCAHRIWAETIYDWPEGHRLLQHVGLSFESLQRGAFGPDKHGVVYARVRGDVTGLPVRAGALVPVIERCVWEDCMPVSRRAA